MRIRLRCSRRQALKTGILAAAGIAIPACRRLAHPRVDPGIPVGVQLYSVRRIAPTDLAGAFVELKSMGYDGVEFAGYFGRPAAELRLMLDDAGLRCCGTHTGIDTIRGDNLARTAEFNLTLGNPYLIVPSLPRQKTAADWARFGAEFQTIAELAAALGTRVGYHAHAHDFQPVDGEIPWYCLFDNAGPAVLMQLDTGNCLAGGGDPVDALGRYPGRSVTVHLKAHGGRRGAAIGADETDWPAVFSLCETVGGTKWYIVEHETSPDSFAGVRACRDGLRRFGR